MNSVVFHSDGATVGHNGKLGTVKEVGLGVYCPLLGLGFYQRVQGMSNNEAEFKALLLAMAIAKHYDTKSPVFRLDSKLVVNRANGHKPKGRKRQNSRMDAFQKMVLERKSWFLSVEFQWVPREENTKADTCSKLACERFECPGNTVKQVTL